MVGLAVFGLSIKPEIDRVLAQSKSGCLRQEEDKVPFAVARARKGKVCYIATLMFTGGIINELHRC